MKILCLILVLAFVCTYVKAQCLVTHVTGKCRNQLPYSSNNPDPPCCERTCHWSSTFTRYTPCLGFRCRRYCSQRFYKWNPYSPISNSKHCSVCPNGWRFSTKQCRCVYKSGVRCRGCPVAKNKPYPICGERHWSVNADVNRDIIRWGTGCRQYKHSALENRWWPEEWKNCYGNKIFNTKTITCEDPGWPRRSNGGSYKCKDPSRPQAKHFPTSPIPTALCMDFHDGYQPPCCEYYNRWSPKWPDGSIKILQKAPLPGSKCWRWEQWYLGKERDTATTHACPWGRRYNTRTCRCDSAWRVACRSNPC